MKRIFSVSGAYISAVIGAGFASGSEIIFFFLKYGRASFFGVLLSAVLFGLFASLILDDCITRQTHSFREYTTQLMGRRLSFLLTLVMGAFMMAVLGAMTAATGEMSFSLFGIPPRFGALFLCILCFLIFLCREEKILSAGGWLGMFLGVGIVLSCIYMILFRLSEAWRISDAIISATSYTCYNVLSSGVLLCSFSRYLHSRREAAAVGILSGGVLFVMLLGLWGTVGIFYGKIPLGEIPMLTLARRYAPPFQIFYGILLFCAILTTAVANGFGMIRLLENKITPFLASVSILAASIFLSGMGLSSLVDRVYRICGYFGLLLPAAIAVDKCRKFYFFNKRRKKENTIE